MIKNVASYEADKTKGKKSWWSALANGYKESAVICEKDVKRSTKPSLTEEK